MVVAANSAELLELCIKAVLHVLAFYSKSLPDVGVADVLALRFVQGQMPLVMQEAFDAGKRLRPDLEKRLFAIEANATALADQAIIYSSETDPSLFVATKEFLDHGVSYFPERRSIQSSKRWRMTHEDVLQDTNADRQSAAIYQLFLDCLVEFGHLGKRADVENAELQCGNISERCEKFWLHERRLAGGHLASRLFLTTVALRADHCTGHFEQLLADLKYKGGLNEFQLELCSNLFYTLEHRIVSRRSSQQVDAMLYVMQLACSHAGFKEFLRISWLLPLLHLQSANGCFIGHVPTMARLDYGRDRQTHKCSMFNTAVATALLVSYTRCLATDDCDTTDSFGRPAVNYDLADVGDGTQVDVDSPWSNKTFLDQLDMISHMQISFRRVNDVTLYWFVLAALVFFVLSFRIRARRGRQSTGAKEKI